MKVTNENINLVMFRLRKLCPNGLTHQYFYPSAKRRNSIGNEVGIFLDQIENSTKPTFCATIVESDDMPWSQKFIRVRNSEFDYHDYMAFIIHAGDTIEFHKNHAVHCCNLAISPEKAINIIKSIN